MNRHSSTLLHRLLSATRGSNTTLTPRLPASSSLLLPQSQSQSQSLRPLTTTTTTTNPPSPNGPQEWADVHKNAPQGGAQIPRDLTLTARQRRIIYRCKQRGWLELDILMGNWAVKHIPHLNEEEEGGGARLAEIELLLHAETPDVLVWVLGHRHPPPQFDTPTLRSMRKFATGSDTVTLKHAPPHTPRLNTNPPSQQS